MDNSTKVTLSDGELSVATDKNIILTKRIVIEKAAALFNNQILIITNLFTTVLKSEQNLIASIPKIAKGENYKGLPYVLMDYPASFSNNDIFALRTMFWWGNFISITLHLKGKYKEKYFEKILKVLDEENSFYIAINDKEWEHSFEPDNFVNIKALTPLDYDKITKQYYFKIALKYELHHWNMMQSILPNGYKTMAEIINC